MATLHDCRYDLGIYNCVAATPPAGKDSEMTGQVSVKDLLEEEIKDLYSAEKQVVKDV